MVTETERARDLGRAYQAWSEYLSGQGLTAEGRTAAQKAQFWMTRAHSDAPFPDPTRTSKYELWLSSPGGLTVSVSLPQTLASTLISQLPVEHQAIVDGGCPIAPWTVTLQAFGDHMTEDDEQ